MSATQSMRALRLCAGKVGLSMCQRGHEGVSGTSNDRGLPVVECPLDWPDSRPQGEASASSSGVMFLFVGGVS